MSLKKKIKWQVRYPGGDFRGSTPKAIYSTTSKKGQVVSWCLDYLSGFYGDFANFKLWTACHKIYNALNDKYMYFYVSKHHKMFPLDQQYFTTGVMAASEIPPQMANFQTFSQGDFFPCQGDF